MSTNKPRSKWRAVAVLVLGTTLCASTALASHASTNIAETGAASTHAQQTSVRPSEGSPAFWPIAVAIAVALLTMSRDYVPPQNEVGFD